MCKILRKLLHKDGWQVLLKRKINSSSVGTLKYPFTFNYIQTEQVFFIYIDLSLFNNFQ